jgi:glycosyltransferase involved in cell wall biosynthesis
MRIAVFSHYYLPEIGAPSARIGDFAAQWLAQGHEVHVATCFPNHPTGIVYPGYETSWYLEESLRGVRVHRSWSYITPNKGFVKKSLGHAAFWLSSSLITKARMPAPACAIGTSPTFFAAMAARACARRHRVPFIMEVRDLWPAIFVDLGVIRNKRIIRLLERWELWLYRSASRIVTVTEAFRQNLISRGVPAEKVVTITNGADTDYWIYQPDGARRLREQLQLGDKTVVLYIGAHGISQGLGAILDAAEKTRTRKDIEYVFVGEGADKDTLVKRAQSRRLENVRFLGAVGKDQVRDFYSMADVCLVPLRNIPLFDTFIPSKMFEIMAVGRPILASVRGEAADILRSSGAAWVVDPENSPAIAAGVCALADDRARGGLMAVSGRDFVRRAYSRRELARRYLETIADARQAMGLGVEK